MAWPAAPFTRLSSAEKTTTRPGAASCTDMRQSFVRSTSDRRGGFGDDAHERRARVERGERRAQISAAGRRVLARRSTDRIPRFTGSRCGQKVSAIAAPGAFAEHGLHLAARGGARARARRRRSRRSTSQKSRSSRSVRPAPVVPLLASTTMSSGSTSRPAQQRDERQQHRRRVAAGVRDEPRAAQAVAVDLGQPVGRRAEQRGRRVIVAVPRAVRVGVRAAAGRRRGRSRPPRAARGAAARRTSAEMPWGSARK